jgi:predicted MFS family arabinose efflux permease
MLIVGFIGTMNPSAGDVSVFLPLEHTALSQVAVPARRTALFARYSLVGSLAGALGILLAPLPEWLDVLGVDPMGSMQAMFALYGLLALAALVPYRRLSPAVEAPSATRHTRAALGPSKRIVYRLAALFCIDSFGSGFFVQSILTLWLFQAFDLSVTATASILVWAGLCSAASFLLAVPLAARFGLVNTMVFTHLPSSLCVMALPFAPNLTVAIILLLVRGMLSQMDVPTRNSYVMAVVRPEERPAAASLTATSRSLASALGPLLAGWMMSVSPFAWPLLIGGALKVAYDLLLLRQFKDVRPEEER